MSLPSPHKGYGAYPQQQQVQSGGMGGRKKGRKNGMGGKGEGLRNLRAGKGEATGTAAKLSQIKMQNGAQGMRRRPGNNGRRQLAAEINQLQDYEDLEKDYESEANEGKILSLLFNLVDDCFS